MGEHYFVLIVCSPLAPPCQDHGGAPATGALPGCLSRSGGGGARLAACQSRLTDLIFRLWTPSPQAGRSSTVLMVQMDQGSVLHSNWLHWLWHGTASYTCACATHTHTQRERTRTWGLVERLCNRKNWRGECKSASARQTQTHYTTRTERERESIWSLHCVQSV